MGGPHWTTLSHLSLWKIFAVFIVSMKSSSSHDPHSLIRLLGKIHNFSQEAVSSLVGVDAVVIFLTPNERNLHECSEDNNYTRGNVDNSCLNDLVYLIIGRSLFTRVQRGQ
jgi:hypothetical protein